MTFDDDDFTLFGVPARQRQNRAVLDARWRALQAEVHPDRFVVEGAAAQRVAMQWSVRVNEAYQRLKDPLRRAAYLCELRGATIDAERNTAMPADFLMRQMHWREALDEAHGATDVQALGNALRAERDALYATLERTLDGDGNGDGEAGGDASAASAAASQVRALMFIERLRNDIESRLETAGL